MSIKISFNFRQVGSLLELWEDMQRKYGLLLAYTPLMYIFSGRKHLILRILDLGDA